MSSTIYCICLWWVLLLVLLVIISLSFAALLAFCLTLSFVPVAHLHLRYAKFLHLTTLFRSISEPHSNKFSIFLHLDIFFDYAERRITHYRANLLLIAYLNRGMSGKVSDMHSGPFCWDVQYEERQYRMGMCSLINLEFFVHTVFLFSLYVNFSMKAANSFIHKAPGFKGRNLTTLGLLH